LLDFLCKLNYDALIHEHHGIGIFTKGKCKIVAQFSEPEQVLAISITVEKITYLNTWKPNMELQGTGKLLCGIFCDVNALEATLSMLHHHHTNEQNNDDFLS
jgi:hypothetical protein